MNQRCEWSDLRPDECACPQHRASRTETAIVVGYSAWSGVGSSDTTKAPQIATRRIWPPKTAAEQRDTRDWNDGTKPPTKSSPCRWVNDWGHYLPEHEPTCRDRNCDGCLPCTHDQHGTPIRHCTAREQCGEHLGPGQPLTCPRCIARTRADLDQIERLHALMAVEAEHDGIDSTPAVIAGPAAHPGAVAELREYVRHHVQAALMRNELTDTQAAKILTDLPDDDDHHPYTLLGRWELALADDYGHQRTGRITVTSAASYLSWLLTDLAQDPNQDFAQFASEIATCRRYLETILGASRAPERGAPCWRCETPAPRLTRRRAHWCDKPDCTRQHDITGTNDTWVCPKDGSHWWREQDYREATTADAAEHDDRKRGDV